MADISSPSDPSHANPQRAALHHIKALSIQLLRRTKGFLEAQKLPYIANKACEAYLGNANRAYQAECRSLLRTRLELNPIQLNYFLRTSVGSTLLVWCEQFLRRSDPKLGNDTLKEWLLQMATEPEGLSLLSVLRHSQTLQPNLEQLLQVAKRLEELLQASDAAIAAIATQATIEAATAPATDFSELTDIRQPGKFRIKRSTLVFDLPNSPTLLRQGRQRAILPDQARRSLQAVCYQPHPLPEGPLPVIIQSHGLGSCPSDLAAYAEHLASYGYVIVAPQHSGSDVEQVRAMLTGGSSDLFELTEFLTRPVEVSALLDCLTDQNQTEFAGQLNLNAVGVMGFSFGTYTAFALAGADMQFEPLAAACDLTRKDLNVSLLLQCQALALPRQVYNLRDDRIKALLAVDSLGSEIFSSTGIEKIQIPVLLIAGSQDVATPLVLEQLRIFQWLTAPDRYLALMKGKSHIQDMQRLVQNLDLQIKLSPRWSAFPGITLFEGYTKALSLAFFNQHLSINDLSIPPVRADYAASISHTPYDLWLLSSRSHQALQETLPVFKDLTNLGRPSASNSQDDCRIG